MKDPLKTCSWGGAEPLLSGNECGAKKIKIERKRKRKRYGTRDSEVIPDLRTNRAWRRLACKFEMGLRASDCTLAVSALLPHFDFFFRRFITRSHHFLPSSNFFPPHITTIPLRFFADSNIMLEIQ